MDAEETRGEALVLALGAAWSAVERRLNGPLGAVRGISLAEYRLLRALAQAPQSRASRVELARLVGLTPSAVTRALRPLEARGLVDTVKNERDARLALAALTPDGIDLVADAAEMIREAMADVFERTPALRKRHAELVTLLADVARV